MTDNKMTFKIVEISGPVYDCECCGSYSSDGLEIYVNDNLVWRKYSDGHLSGDQTEDTILNCVTKEWNNISVANIESEYTEKKRHAWNKRCPGNAIARTPESWLEYKNSMLDFQKDNLENVIESCQNLPYDEALQVKMIALWIESASSEKIIVEETSFYEGGDDDDDDY